jgi:O-antigen/teichoic acid export membrane protein
VSTQAAVAGDLRARPPHRSASFSGAWLLSGAMVVSGVLTYAFHVLAARTLGPSAYGQIAVLWGAIFLGAIVLFRPIEQTTSRSIADRLARGEEAAPVVRPILALSATLMAVIAVAAALAWRPLTDHLFAGDNAMTAMLVGGTLAYGLSYVVRGLVGGVRWFRGYGLGLLSDSVGRLAVAAPLVFIASKSLAAFAVVVAGVVGALVPLYFGRRELEVLRAEGRGSGGFRTVSALSFAAPASLMAGADQVLVNGAPLLVVLGTGHADKTVGVVFAATMLVRAPVYVFQGLAASLLPNFTVLHAAERQRFLSVVHRAVVVLLAVGACIVVVSAVAGPEAMRMLYGDAYSVSRGDLVLLGLGVACYLGASTFSQALLALDCGSRAAAAWCASAVAFVVLYVVLPWSQLTRISLAFAVAMSGGLVLLWLLLTRHRPAG